MNPGGTIGQEAVGPLPNLSLDPRENARPSCLRSANPGLPAPPFAVDAAPCYSPFCQHVRAVDTGSTRLARRLLLLEIVEGNLREREATSRRNSGTTDDKRIGS